MTKIYTWARVGAAAGVVLLGGCYPPSPKAGAAGTPKVAGVYHRRSPATGEMRISAEKDGRWRIAISAGAAPAADGYVPGDCEAVAVGRYEGGRIVASGVPFEGEDISVSAEDLTAKPVQIVVTVAGTHARIVSSNAEKFCGVGSDLTGTYLRTRAAAGPLPQ